MKFKFYTIIICLSILVLGCKNTSTIPRIEKIGRLVSNDETCPGKLEVYNRETDSDEIYKLYHLYRIISDNHYVIRDDDFFYPYFNKIVKVKGIESNSWVELSDGNKILVLEILVESIELYEGDYDDGEEDIPSLESPDSNPFQENE